MKLSISKMLRPSVYIPVASGGVGLGVGIAIGFILGKRKPVPVMLEVGARPESYWDKEHEVSIRPEPVVIEETEYHKVKEERIELVTDEIASREVIESNIFAANDEDWNYEEEISARTPVNPYVIHRDEFFENQHEYPQSTLTYYAGDDIVVDHEDQPVFNYLTVTGELKFGHGSGDPNVVYVRNDKRHAEYEIVKDEGLYSREVLGLEIEDNDRTKDLRHHRVPRFRSD